MVAPDDHVRDRGVVFSKKFKTIDRPVQNARQPRVVHQVERVGSRCDEPRWFQLVDGLLQRVGRLLLQVRHVGGVVPGLAGRGPPQPHGVFGFVVVGRDQHDVVEPECPLGRRFAQGHDLGVKQADGVGHHDPEPKVSRLKHHRAYPDVVVDRGGLAADVEAREVHRAVFERGRDRARGSTRPKGAVGPFAAQGPRAHQRRGAAFAVGENAAVHGDRRRRGNR